jgi:hypothetical protein
MTTTDALARAAEIVASYDGKPPPSPISLSGDYPLLDRGGSCSKCGTNDPVWRIRQGGKLRCTACAASLLRLNWDDLCLACIELQDAHANVGCYRVPRPNIPRHEWRCKRCGTTNSARQPAFDEETARDRIQFRAPVLALRRREDRQKDRPEPDEQQVRELIETARADRPILRLTPASSGPPWHVFEVLRLALGCHSQGKFAKLCGLNPSHFAQGRVEVNHETLARVASVHGWTIEQLETVLIFLTQGQYPGRVFYWPIPEAVQ